MAVSRKAAATLMYGIKTCTVFYTRLFDVKIDLGVPLVVSLATHFRVGVFESEARLLLCQLYEVVELDHVGSLQSLELLEVRYLAPQLPMKVPNNVVDICVHIYPRIDRGTGDRGRGNGDTELGNKGYDMGHGVSDRGIGNRGQGTRRRQYGIGDRG